MDILEAIKNRHSVREYLDIPIAEDILNELLDETKKCNEEGNLHIQIIANEEEAFGGIIAHYGRFRNVRNYIAMIGKDEKELDEKVGYYGEKLVLRAQQLGLNTCWVVSTYSKDKCKAEVSGGERLACVISLGYGKTQGIPHKNKDMSKLCKVDGEMPDWFRKGMEAAMLAPTAMNQQKFMFALKGEEVEVKNQFGGVRADIDKGIVKYHFEVATGKKL